MAERRLLDHLEKLNHFTAVAQSRSFHKAARQLNVSQPSLSQSVKILEEALGTPLFVRSQKGVSLTAAGTTLLQFSERLQSEVAGVEGQIKHPENPMVGTLKLGTYATLTSYLLPKFLTHMARKYPRLNLGVSTLKADELAEALFSKRCHFVIGSVKFSQKSLNQIDLYSDSFGFFVHPDFFEQVPVPNLSQAPLIYVPTAKDGRGKSIEKTLKAAKIQNLHQYDVDNFDSVQSLVLEGLGVGVLPLRLAESSLVSGRLVPVALPTLGKKFGVHSFYCSSLTQEATEPRLQVVIKELEAWCQRLAHTKVDLGAR